MPNANSEKLEDARRRRAEVRNADAIGTRKNERRPMFRELLCLPMASVLPIGGTETSGRRRFSGSFRTSHGLPVHAHMAAPDVKHNSRRLADGSFLSCAPGEAARAINRHQPALPAAPLSADPTWIIQISSLRVGFVVIRRGIGCGALGFAQRGFLVLPSLLLFAPRAGRPVAFGAISSVIRLECHLHPPECDGLISSSIALSMYLFEVLPVLVICPLGRFPGQC
jgi:hypothetical protein